MTTYHVCYGLAIVSQRARGGRAKERGREIADSNSTIKLYFILYQKAIK